MDSSRAGIDRTVPASSSELMFFEGKAGATAAKPDEVATADPMAMSRVMPLSEVVKAQNEHIDHLENKQKEQAASLTAKQEEVDEVKKTLSRELGVSAERGNAIMVAKAKQEELEKELGLRKKSAEEAAVATQKKIEDRMFRAILSARSVMLREWTNDSGKKRCLAYPLDSSMVAGYEQMILQLASKIYDELKAAEEVGREKEKPELTDEEFNALVRRAGKIGIVPGHPEEVDAALSSIVLQRLLE